MKKKLFPRFMCFGLISLTGLPLFLNALSNTSSNLHYAAIFPSRSLIAELPALYTINTVYIYSPYSAEAWKPGREYTDAATGQIYSSGKRVERGENRSCLNVCHKHFIVRVQENGAVNYTLRHRNTPVVPLSVTEERIIYDFESITEEVENLTEAVRSRVPQTAGSDALLPGTVLKGLHLRIVTDTEYTPEFKEQFRTNLRASITAVYGYALKVTVSSRKPRAGASESYQMEIKYEQYEFSDEDIKKMEILENAAKTGEVYPHEKVFE